MLQALHKYFILNKRAGIPGIGNFHIRRQPASLDFTNKAFIAPCPQIVFSEGAVTADPKFYSFLAKEQQIEEEVAVKHFGEFAETLKDNLQTQGSLQLRGFGLLSIDAHGKLSFHAVNPIASFYPNMPLERTIREVSVEKPAPVVSKKKDKKTAVAENGVTEAGAAKKDYWWLFALILAAIAIAAIFYYYKENGTFR